MNNINLTKKIAVELKKGSTVICYTHMVRLEDGDLLICKIDGNIRLGTFKNYVPDDTLCLGYLAFDKVDLHVLETLECRLKEKKKEKERESEIQIIKQVLQLLKDGNNKLQDVLNEVSNKETADSHKEFLKEAYDININDMQ